MMELITTVADDLERQAAQAWIDRHREFLRALAEWPDLQRFVIDAFLAGMLHGESIAMERFRKVMSG
jgi:hypothetical protein